MDGQTEVVNRTLGALLRALVQKNLKSWEECIPHIEFAYNRSMHSSHNHSPVFVVYGFYPLTPLDLCVLPNKEMTNSNASKRAMKVKQLHEEVKLALEKKAANNARAANRNRKEVIFEPGDWVWVHFGKERFPEQRKSKLNPRGDGPFQILERINNNAYKVDLPGEYQVSSTFNVSDLSHFVVGDEWSDLRTNPREEGGDDEDINMKDTTYRGGGARDALHMPNGPITRSRLKQFQQALNTFMEGHLNTNTPMEPKAIPSYINMLAWEPNETNT